MSTRVASRALSFACIAALSAGCGPEAGSDHATAAEAVATDYKLTFTGPSSVSIGGCATYTISRLLQDGSPGNAGAPQTFTLSGQGHGAYYAALDTNCNGAPLTSVPLAIGAYQSDVRFRDDTRESVTLHAQWNVLSVTKAVAVTGAPPVAARLFGLDVRYTSTSPSAPFAGGIARVPGTTWTYIEPTNCGTDDPTSSCFQWWGLDHAVANARAHGVPYLYTFDHIPSWAAPYENSSGEIPTLHTWQSITDFATAVARRYASTGVQPGCSSADPQCHGVIAYYTVFNEPNGDTTAVKMADLVMFGQKVYQAVKAADPKARVGGPSFAVQNYPITTAAGNSFVKYAQLYYASGGSAHADFADWHPYACDPNFNAGYCPAAYGCAMKSDILACAGQPLLNQYADYRAMLDANGMAGRPIVATEAGWGKDQPDQCGKASCFKSLSSLDDEPAYVARTFILLASASANGTTGVQTVYWNGWDIDWGTLDGAYSQNPNAAVAFATVQKWLVGSSFASRCAVNNHLWTCNLTTASGARAEIVWNDAAGQTANYTVPAYVTRVTNLLGTAAAIPTSRGIVARAAPVLLQ
jgi:hypothetical protein